MSKYIIEFRKILRNIEKVFVPLIIANLRRRKTNILEDIRDTIRNIFESFSDETPFGNSDFGKRVISRYETYIDNVSASDYFSGVSSPIRYSTAMAAIGGLSDISFVEEFLKRLGKTTLINFLAFGTEKMEQEENGDLVLKNKDDEEAMKIGTGGKSETIFPKSIDLNGLHLFDLPGLNDTEGSTKNLIGAAFIRKIFITAKTVKIVIVVSHEEIIASRGDQLTLILKSIKNLFRIPERDSDEILKRYSLFVLTKSILSEINLVKADLLKKANDTNKKILRIWLDNGNFTFMCHSLTQGSNLEKEKEDILLRVKNLDHCCFRGDNSKNIDVSFLYPNNTLTELQKIFHYEFERAYLKLVDKLSLEEINNAITSVPPLNWGNNAITPVLPPDWSNNAAVSRWGTNTSSAFKFSFWYQIEGEVLKIQEVSFLKEFCEQPFIEALKDLKNRKTQDLKKRMDEIEKRLKDETNSILGKTLEKTRSEQAPSSVRIEIDVNFYKNLKDTLFREIRKITSIRKKEEIILLKEYENFITAYKVEKVKEYQDAIEAAQKYAWKTLGFTDNKNPWKSQ